MTTSEPTTGEVVRALRCVADDTECKDCRYKYPVGNVILCDHEQMNGNAADRLESQEREIAELTASRDRMTDAVAELTMKVGELTARAEQAERERDAAVADCERLLFASRDMRTCYLCKFVSTDGKCNRKGVGAGCKPKYRGLPQDGEGK